MLIPILKMTKKAQLHLMESTVVMFVFFLLVMVGLTVYSNYQNAKIERIRIEMNEQKAVQIAKKVLFTPEIECSNNNARTLDCIEIQKLKPFVERVKQNPAYYRQEFGNAKVSVRWVYSPAFTGAFSSPEFFRANPTDTLVTAPHKQLFDFRAGGASHKTFTFPILLWDKRKVPEWNYFGWLEVEVNI